MKEALFAVLIVASTLCCAVGERYRGDPMDLPIDIQSTHLSVRRGIQWLNESVGFALIEDGSVMRTTDYGKTWFNTSIVAGSQVRGIFPQPASNGLNVIFLGSDGSYATTDGGEIIKKVEFPNATWVQYHPLNKAWAILMHQEGRNQTGVATATLNLFMGDTTHWTVIHNNVWEASFCNVLSADDPSVCLIFDLGMGDRQLCVDKQFGDNCTYPLPGVVVRHLHETPYYFIAIADDAYYVSMDNLETAPVKAEFPGGMTMTFLDDHQFLDDRRKAVWVAGPATAYTPGKPQNGNVFVSDREGSKLTLSLRNIHSFDNSYDFAIVESLNGTYIANEMYEFAGGYYVSPENTTLSKTKITFDYGNTWSFLPAPEVDRNGNPIVCEGICSLNLFGESAMWRRDGHTGGIYTKESAVGIIVATGNVGDFLVWEQNQTNTYVSHNGGRSWREAFEGSWDYAYGQNSGILILIKPGNESRMFYWSTNDGETFNEQSFSPVNLTVFRIYNFDSSGDHFMIDAMQNGEFVLITLDFSKVFERSCSSSDMYLWQPETAIGNSTCVNGMTITYVRRRYNANCTSLLDGTIHSTTPCACTRSDYECDYNYSPMVNGQCFGYPPDPSTLCPPTGGGTYVKTKGYRRTADNSCIGQTAWDPVETPCPPLTTTSSSGSSTSTSSSSSSSSSSSDSTSTTTQGFSSSTFSTGSSGEKIIKEGVSSGGAAAGIIIVAIVIGIAAFIGGVVAAFRSSRVRGAVPQDWKSGEATRLL